MCEGVRCYMAQLSSDGVEESSSENGGGDRQTNGRTNAGRGWGLLLLLLLLLTEWSGRCWGGDEEAGLRHDSIK